MRVLIRSFWILVLAALALAAAVSAQAAGTSPDGKSIYEKECRRCHGVQGVPPQSMKRLMPTLPVLDASFASKRTEEAVVDVLKKGKGDSMKPFTEKLKPEEIVAVAKYVRQLAPQSTGK